MRHLRSFLIVIVISLVLLEVVLQGLALFLYTRHSKKPSHENADLTVTQKILCVGDSHTFGIGAESKKLSYPSQLQERLHATYPESQWQVINAGWPGQNSRDVLLNLKSQLEEHRPALTCVLIGTNDYWSVPDTLTEAETLVGKNKQFEWKWRSGRLLTLILAQKDSGEVVATSPAAETPATFKIVPKTFTDPQYPYPQNETVGALKAAAWEGQASGDAAKTSQNAQQALALFPDDPQALQLLVWAESVLGNKEEVHRHIATFERLFKEDPEYWVCREMLWALFSAGERDRRREIAKEMTEIHPDHPFFWSIYAFESSEIGEFEIARQASDVAMSLDPRSEDYDMRELTFTSIGDHHEALTSLMKMYLLSGNESFFLHQLRNRNQPEELFLAVLETLDCSEPERTHLLQLKQLAFAKDLTAIQTTLSSHLSAIAALCSSHGSEPILMTYATDIPSTQQNNHPPLVQELCQKISVTCIDHNRHFRALPASQPMADLMAHDGGHVNETGYALMAENILTGLTEAGHLQMPPNARNDTAGSMPQPSPAPEAVPETARE